jgi:hypothetical protein
MKTFIITNRLDPLSDMMKQHDILVKEIDEKLLVPHLQHVAEYELELKRQQDKIAQEEDEKREHRIQLLQEYEAQYRDIFATEERVIRSLGTQIMHIVVTEIINRKPLHVLCEYKTVLFTIPLRYK